MLAFMFMFAGCDANTDDTKQNALVLTGAYNGGDNALSLKFVDGQPPSKIRDGGLQPFNIRMLIENLGEYTIPENKTHVCLSGINHKEFGIEDSSLDIPELRGVKKQGTNTINGAILPVLFSNLKYYPELPAGTNKQKILVDLSYPYKTKALISLCVSGNTLQTQDKTLKVCEIEGKRTFANSGSPVQINNVIQTPAGPNSLMLQFDIIKKSKSGRIYRPSTLDEECRVLGNSVASSEASMSENYVEYIVDTNGVGSISCGGSNQNSEVVLLTNSKTTVYCTIDTKGEQDYEKPISVELNYDYFERFELSVDIEHVAR